jgi:hypothetical protein
MLFTPQETLEDRIIRYLLLGEQTVGQLHNLLKADSQTYSIQAIYGILRNLLRDEVVVKRGVVYYLNQEWRIKASFFLQEHGNFLPEEGERVSYSLSSLAHTDLQWKNIVLPLEEQNPGQPIFFYSYHYVWLHLSQGRKKSELEYFAGLTKNKTHAFCLIGSDSMQDKEDKRIIQNEVIQVSLGKKIFSERECKTVFGDYIITTGYSPTLAKEIGECYKKSSNVITLEPLLYEINNQKKKVTLTIERNKAKAKNIRKKFATQFFVPKELVQKFDLY